VDEVFDAEAIEAARVLFARPVEFLLGAAAVAQLPEPDLPEVAFAGRSNVGKSSLINALTGQKHLARASNEPGRTREVNLFRLDGRVRLVDLPGYGFAQASKTTVAKFQNLGRAYLRGRPNLKRVYLLIDARHGLKKVDAEALDALDQAAVSYQIVLTKADKVRPASDLAKVEAATLKGISRRPAAFPRVAVTSSETGAGIPELRAEIAAAAGLIDPPSPKTGDDRGG
jgi:GTP-binding protein